MDRFILIVEKELENKDRIGSLLNEAGFKVAFVNDAESGLRVLIRLRPYMIIIGLNMPKLDSYTFTRVLKYDEDTAGIIVVALVKPDIKPDYEKILVSGFDEFIKIVPGPERFVNEITGLLKYRETFKTI